MRVPYENAQSPGSIEADVLREAGVIVHDRELLENPARWSSKAQHSRTHLPILMARARTDLGRWLPRKPLVDFASENCPYQVSPGLEVCHGAKSANENGTRECSRIPFLSMVELTRIELVTSCLPDRRSPS